MWVFHLPPSPKLPSPPLSLHLLRACLLLTSVAVSGCWLPSSPSSTSCPCEFAMFAFVFHRFAFVGTWQQRGRGRRCSRRAGATKRARIGSVRVLVRVCVRVCVCARREMAEAHLTPHTTVTAEMDSASMSAEMERMQADEETTKEGERGCQCLCVCVCVSVCLCAYAFNRTLSQR